MIRYITFDHETKASETSHEHVTIAFHDNGTLSVLSRDSTRSVARKWDAIGTFEETGFGLPRFRFTENSKAIRMVATKLYRKGACVSFASGEFDPTSGEFRLIRSLLSDGITTNPESIMGRIRDRNTDKKRASVQKRFGAMGQCDVKAMRDAIKRR